MTRSFGDFIGTPIGVIWEPEVDEFNREANDRFVLLASDGIWSVLSNERCVEIISPFYETKQI